MWRVFVAPIVGYIVMVIVVMLGIAAVWFSMGASFAFDGNTVNASLGWTLAMLVAGLIAAIVGGMVASMIGGWQYAAKAVMGLAGLILVMGLLTIVLQSMAEPTPVPADFNVADLSFTDAGKYSRSPMWYNFAIVVVGIVGTLVGGKLIKPGVNQNQQSE